MSDRVSSALSLVPKGEQQMYIATFGSGRKDPQICQVVSLGMRVREGRDVILSLFDVPTICEPLEGQPITLCARQYDHLSQLELADASDGGSQMQVDLLIGSDYYWELATGEVRRGIGGPIAIRTRLGWVLSGPTMSWHPSQSSLSLINTHTLRVEFLPLYPGDADSTLKSFWELESLGITETERSVYDEFTDAIEYKNGRYEVALPWKELHPVLPDNYQPSLKRLHGLLRRLRQNPRILQEYNSIIQMQIQQGIVEAVEQPQNSEVGRVHYLPHHAVVRHDKETTKVRVVYDASAKSEGVSLNDCLYSGPKFDQRVFDILLRFRTHRVALTADVEKAFLMVSMAEQDRDVLHFLWVDEVWSDNSELRVLRFNRVVFGVSCSPFLLNATIRHHLDKFSSTHPELVRMLQRSIYVDDIICGADCEENAERVYLESKDILKKGGFNLRKFVSNSARVQEKIDKAEKIPDLAAKSSAKGDTDSVEDTYTKTVLGASQRIHVGEQKVLGIRWNVDTDQFTFSFEDIAHLVREMEPTKRNVVSAVGRFYDPLGFLSPVVIEFKKLFQEARVDWDEPLSGELLSKWLSLSRLLLEGQPVSIPRYYLEGIPQADTYTLCLL